ncbi:MAG: hypothetical protein A2X47_08305 [Lentisphaerae bacterium GWF2_38_69]|nr:MAG: hypothetical protein A2X47_08305 [Lentisphaerae bacterium GWF2_38_69]
MFSKDKRLVFLLTFVIVLALSATDIYVSSLPEMTRYFNTTGEIVNMTLSVFVIGLAIGTLFSGLLSDRFGRRTVLLWANGLFIIITISIAFLNSIWLIIALRFLQSLCVSCNVIISRQIIRDYFNVKQQITATATMLSGVILSPALAPVAGAYLSGLYNWKLCFIASSVIGLAVFIWLYKSLPETNKNKLEKLPSLKDFLKVYLSLAVSKRFSGYAIVNGCAYATYFTFITISSYVYIREYGISPQTYSFVFILLAVAYLIGNSITKIFVKKKVRPKIAVLTGCYLSAICGFINCLYFLSPHNSTLAITVFTVSALLARIGIGIINAPMQVLTMNDYSEKSGQSIGLLYFLMFIFESAAATLVSEFHRNPPLGLVIITALFSIITVPLWIMTMKARRKPHNFLPEFLKNFE